MKSSMNIRWAYYFGRFHPQWFVQSRQDKLAAIRQFIALDTHGVVPANPHPLLEWIKSGKQWFTSSQNAVRKTWCTDKWEGLAHDFYSMPVWVFDGFYAWMKNLGDLKDQMNDVLPSCDRRI
jgi:hypothetical protein